MNKRLFELRKYFGISQKEFAERLGLSQSTYSPLEKDREIRDAHVKLICNAYNVNEEWFRYGTLPMFLEERDRELDELLRVYDKLTPTLQKYLLKQAKELQELNQSREI
ncbi:MAG: helix-turn-helix domain-containing protein [Clostridiales bacterium]|jgi:transcriptional regulator with XRE-family HTH domain|nr:helix-turn-helix domain-containing protein [Clostridiales bacterium]